MDAPRSELTERAPRPPGADLGQIECSLAGGAGHLVRIFCPAASRPPSSRDRRAMPRSLAFLLAALALSHPPPGADATPRVYAGSDPRRGIACANAVENAHLVADSRGATCVPLALDATTGCCLEPRTVASAEVCAESCTPSACCDSYAQCVTCCHRAVRADAHATVVSRPELTPVSRMHPSMWRAWLLARDPKKRAGAGSLRGETFNPKRDGRDDYDVPPFEYCAHRCRTNAEATRYENEFQDPRHHCFADAYVETQGAKDTLSPGRDQLHEQNGDFKLVGGVSVPLGLVPRLRRPSDAANDETGAETTTTPPRKAAAFFGKKRRLEADAASGGDPTFSTTTTLHSDGAFRNRAPAVAAEVGAVALAVLAGARARRARRRRARAKAEER